jgi:hypothetical protein
MVARFAIGHRLAHVQHSSHVAARDGHDAKRALPACIGGGMGGLPSHWNALKIR